MSDSFVTFLSLTALVVPYLRIVTGMERLRLTVSQRQVSSMLGVFTFAAITVLPLELLPPFVALVYAVAWPTFRRAGAPLHRHAYNCAAATLAALASSEVTHTVPGVASIPVGILTFMALNLSLVLIVIRATGHVEALPMLRNPHTHQVVLCSQILGATMGGLAQWHLAAGAVALPLTFAYHRLALRGTVKDTAAFDTDLGLWSEDAWKALAGELVRGGECVTLMIIDATSSAEMRVLAEVVRGCLRQTDALGRYGNGQQIALLTVSGSSSAGRVLTSRVRNSLSRASAHYTLGSCTAQGWDLYDMLMAALTDVMSAQDRSVSPG